MAAAINFEEDINSPSSAQLKTINEIVAQQLKCEAEVAEAEENLKAKQKNLRHIAEVLLPEALTAAGVEEVKLGNGIRIKIKSDLTCSVPKDRLGQICAWLREEGHDDIIKQELSVPLGKGFDQKVLAGIRAGLERKGIVYAMEETVHTSTLKALLKEQLEAGKFKGNLQDFGAFPLRKAEIKLPK